MPWFALKTCLFEGRQVQPGDHLPEADSWGRAKAERRALSRRIAYAPEGSVIEMLPGGKWRVVSAPAHTEPPPVPAQAEPRTPTPGASVGPGVDEPKAAEDVAAAPNAPAAHEDSKPKGKGKKRWNS